MLRLLWKVVPWVLVGILIVILARQVYPSVDLDATYGPAPDFELRDLDDEVFRLSDHAGEVVVINFWATWCPPCRAEIPAFVNLQDALRDEGVLFVGVSLDDEGAEVVKPFADARSINYPILLEGHSVAARFGGVYALPTTILIDRDGMIRFRHEGFLLPQALRPAIRTLSRETAS